jgi:hypothetical protein
MTLGTDKKYTLIAVPRTWLSVQHRRKNASGEKALYIDRTMIVSDDQWRGGNEA